MTCLLVLAFELLDEVVDKAVVKVLTTQMCVTGCRLDLEDPLFDREQRDIECAASQVEDQHVTLALCLLVETVGNCCCSRFVDDTKDVQTGNETGIFGSLTLRVVEVGWDCHDRVVDCASKICLCSLSHLGQDHCGDLFRCELLVLALELDRYHWLARLFHDLEREVLHVALDFGVTEFAADQTLGIEDSVRWVHRHLVLRRVPDQALSVREGHERGSGAIALVIGYDLYTIVTEYAPFGR